MLIASGCDEGGFSEIALKSDGSFSDTITSPGISALSAVSTDDYSQYNNTVGLWAVYRIFAITAPVVPSGNDYVLYATVIDSTYDGLWSYYSGTQNEWNRE